MEKKNIWIAFVIIGIVVLIPILFFSLSLFLQFRSAQQMKEEMQELTLEEIAPQHDLEKNYCVYLYPDHIRLLTSDTDEEITYEDFGTVLKTQLTDTSKTILLLTNNDTDATRVSGIMNILSEQQVTNYDLMSE
jgi:biopolymer transport protein ExbD